MTKKADAPDFTPVTRVELRRGDISDVVLKDPLVRGAAFVRALGERAAETLRLGIARRFPDKVPVFRQGDSGESLFLVLSGEARVFARAGSDVVELGTAAKGEVFGEDEVLGGEGVRSSSAVAAGELDVVELPRKVLADLAKQRPDVLKCLTDVQKQRAEKREEMASFLNRW